MEANTNAASVQSKLLGNECIPTTNNPTNATTVQQQHDNNSNLIEINQESMDNNQSDCDLDAISNDEQSSEPSNDALGLKSSNYSNQRVKFASPKSSSENTLDDRRLRRQIANCNERRRMQSINAGFQALRQFLPQRSGEKLSKAAILQQTAELIQTLQLGRRSSAECKPTSDEEANAEVDKPQCKKRRLTIKTEPRTSVDVKQEQNNQQHMETRLNDYIKIIEELREALGKEQQLRLLYEQKLTDLKTTLSASLGFSSMPSGINLDRNENIQQQPNIHQRSNSADGLLAPKNLNDNNSSSTLLYNNLTALTEAALNYNNQLRMARQSNHHNALSALLSPNALNNLHFGATTPFNQQPIQNIQPFVNLIAASLQPSSTHDVLPLASQATINQQSPTNGIQTTPNQNTLYAIAEALKQIENESSKNFPTESLPSPSDVLVR